MEHKVLGRLPCFVGQSVIVSPKLSSVDITKPRKPANTWQRILRTAVGGNLVLQASGRAAGSRQSRRMFSLYRKVFRVWTRGGRFTSDQKEAFTTNAGVTITTYTMISYCEGF